MVKKTPNICIYFEIQMKKKVREMFSCCKCQKCPRKVHPRSNDIAFHYFIMVDPTRLELDNVDNTLVAGCISTSRKTFFMKKCPL